MEINEARQKMKKSIEVLLSDLKQLRTSKASGTLIEDIKVNTYGTFMPVSQLATIIVSDVNLLIVQPWDKTNITSIKNAILDANIGLSPVESEDNLRISIPSLSEERRLDFIKILNTKIEGARISVRNIRRDYINDRKKEKENVGEDDYKRSIDDIDNLSKEINDEIENIFEDKKKDLLEI
jgi:ribosome recycling factor